MNRKTFLSFLMVIAIIAAGVFMVSAQDDAPAPFGPGWMHQWDGDDFGPGMMGGMHGGFGMGMMWGDGEPMMVTVAEALGLTTDELFAALEDQTLAEIAEAQGVELDAVYDAMFAEAEAHMTVLVESGVITQEQSDEHLTWMQDNITEMPMFTGTGFGPCMGGQSGLGYGMHGRGHGMMGNWRNG